jgi:thiol-disulfide isomerase/thioredoxin
MIPLPTQELFESLLKPVQDNGALAEEAVVVYFTASWCGACKRIDWKSLLESTPKNIVWYKCDVDENQYTLGYCQLTKIPSFAVIKNGKFVGKFSTSDTLAVFDNLKQLLA